MGDIRRTISIRGKCWSRLGDRVSVLASLEFERVSGVCLLCSCRWQMQQVASYRRQGHRRSTTTTTTIPAAAAASTTSDNAAFKTVFGNSFAFCLLCFCLCFFLSLFCQSGQFGEFFFYHMLLTAWASFFLRHLVAVFGCCCCCSCARISFLAHPVAHMAPLRELWLYRRRHT